MGRVAYFKIMLLSHIIYIFRTLPIPVQPTYMQSLTSLAKKFIWQKKEPVLHTPISLNTIRLEELALKTFQITGLPHKWPNWSSGPPPLENLLVDNESYLLHTSDLKVTLLADIWKQVNITPFPAIIKATLLSLRAFTHPVVYNTHNSAVLTPLSALEFIIAHFLYNGGRKPASTGWMTYFLVLNSNS